MTLHPLKHSDENSNCTLRNKKDKSNMNSVTKRKKHKYHYSHINLSFFLIVQFEFRSEFFRGCRIMSLEHPHFLDSSEKFKLGF